MLMPPVNFFILFATPSRALFKAWFMASFTQSSPSLPMTLPIMTAGWSIVFRARMRFGRLGIPPKDLARVGSIFIVSWVVPRGSRVAA